MKRLFHIFVSVLVLLAVIGFIGFRYYSPLGALVLVGIGRGPECSGAATAYYRSTRNPVDDIGSRTHIKHAESDDFQLSDTPEGRFWEPRMGGSQVVAQLAEMHVKYPGGLPLRAGSVVLDCGANVGTFTKAALKQGAALVVAIEPAPLNIECLRRNLHDHINSGKVILYGKGVWDREEMLPLFEDDVSAMDSFVRSGSKQTGRVLPLTTIDKIVAELKLSRVDFIKLDIEGAETRAINGAAETLRRFRPDLEIEVSVNNQAVTVPRLLAGFVPYNFTCLSCVLGESWHIEPQVIMARHED